MAFTIEFLYENGEPIRTLDNEVLDEAKLESIMGLQIFDTIPLGSGSEKQNYMVLKINREVISAKLSGRSEDDMYLEFTVKAVSDKEKT